MFLQSYVEHLWHGVILVKLLGKDIAAAVHTVGSCLELHDFLYVIM